MAFQFAEDIKGIIFNLNLGSLFSFVLNKVDEPYDVAPCQDTAVIFFEVLGPSDLLPKHEYTSF